MDGEPHLFYNLLLHSQAFTVVNNLCKVILQQCTTALLLSQRLLGRISDVVILLTQDLVKST